MCCNRTANAQIDRIHEKALRIIYNDQKSSFSFLLEKSKTVRIHHRNLQLLATEMYKVQKEISPIFMRDIFQLKESTYSLRHTSTFQTGNVRTVFNGTETISYLGPKIWEQLPNELKMSENLAIFKKNVRYWIPKNCPCRLCKVYVTNLGFL